MDRASRNEALVTTLTMQNESFSVVLTYNPDGSVDTYTQRGVFDKFTVPGGGAVLLDTGKVIFDEPSEDVVFIAGPHQAVRGEFEAFCAAFGQYGTPQDAEKPGPEGAGLRP